VLGNEHDAEDVFQATFLTLARKAAVVCWQDSVKNWLRAVAGRLALQARCSAGRRGFDQHDLPEQDDPRADPLAEVARRELRLVLDEELRQLPDKYREPIVLCYLEGKTNEQAAGELGWPAGSMSRRLARARALLHDRLTRRGLALLVLAGLALGAFWLCRPPSSGTEPTPVISQAMTPFRPVGDGGEGFEKALFHLAEDGQAGADRERLVGVAHRTAQVAGAIQDHDPGQRRQDWRRLSDEMRRSALDLADALASNDQRTTMAAARRLTATCQTCHATFRE
jgi:RNA polymerase sigma-70 factor (ECF subfamily)